MLEIVSSNRLVLPLTLIVGILSAGCDQKLLPQQSQGHGQSSSSEVFDLEGQAVDPFLVTDAEVIVFIFVRFDCPVSNRYAPEVRRIYEAYAPRGAAFYLVYPDPDRTAEEIRNHMTEYNYPCEALRDPNHALVNLTGASISPEAAVFVSGRKMVYRGRISNWYQDFGVARRRPTTHDLTLALDRAILGDIGKLVTTRAVGCYLADVR